jgi:hypothetical protein
LRVVVAVAALLVGACTSTGDPAADSTPSIPAPSTVPDSTTTTVAVPMPLPADLAQVEVGKTYAYELTAHCSFTSLDGEIAGSYWWTTSDYDWRDLEAWLDSDESYGSVGLIGELHYASTEQMIFTVPGTELMIEYGRIDEPVTCY